MPASDLKITALTALTAADPANDVLPIVDVSDNSMAASGTTKKISINNILACSPAATLASATITGDLTARTTGLTVNSSGVGIGTNLQSSFVGNSPKKLVIGDGTQTPALTLYGGSAYVGGLYFADGTVGNQTYRGYVEYDHNTDSFGLGISGSLAMTLNATGLGVGVNPLYKLHAVVTSGAVGAFRASTAAIARLLVGNTVEDVELKVNANGDGQLTANASKYLGLGSGGINDRVILDTAGNVGIGVTPSAWVSYQKAIDFGGAGNYGSVSARTDFSSFATNCYFNGTSWIYKNTYPAYSYEHTGGVHKWNTAPSGTAGTAITFTQAMTLDASGNLLVGKTSSANSAAGVNIYKDATDGGRVYLTRQSGSAVQYNVAFFESGGAAVGSISTTNTATSYNISSDYRLKEAVQPLVGGLARISALKPSIYKWKIDGSSSEGFLAHELAEAVPLAVTGDKDALNEDGSIKPQAVDLSKVVPVLVAAIQELTARVQTLETR